MKKTYACEGFILWCNELSPCRDVKAAGVHIFFVFEVDGTPNTTSGHLTSMASVLFNVKIDVGDTYKTRGPSDFL